METVIYEEDKNGQIKVSNLETYMNTEGVWALFGKRKDDNSDYICLNVGKTKNIGSEILYDIGCLHFLKYRKDGTRRFVNQFKEEYCLKYESGQTQEYLYPFIAQYFNSFKFVYVFDKSDINEEKVYAEKNHAQFWRNGGSYKKGDELINL